MGSMSPTLSEIFWNRRFWIAVIILVMSGLIIWGAIGVYGTYLEWQIALNEGPPFTTDIQDLLQWIGLVIGFPVMIILVIGIYGYAAIMFLSLRRS